MKLAGKRRPLTAANIKAASLSNLAKRRRTAASIDSASMFQDSIKKCVKLVTNDLQKVGSTDLKGPPKPLPPNFGQKSPFTLPKSITNPTVRQPAQRNSLGSVSNAFLKGISLLSTSVPKVTPYIKPQTPQRPPINRTVIRNLPGNIVKVTRNAANETTIIDVEDSSPKQGGPIGPPPSLQLTHPTLQTSSSSVPTANLASSNINALAMNIPSSSMSIPGNSIPKPSVTSAAQRKSVVCLPSTQSLTVNMNKASAIQSLVRKLNKKPIIALKKSSIPPHQRPFLHKSVQEVICLDQEESSSNAPNSKEKTPDEPTPSEYTAVSTNILSALNLQSITEEGSEASGPTDKDQDGEGNKSNSCDEGMPELECGLQKNATLAESDFPKQIFAESTPETATEAATETGPCLDGIKVEADIKVEDLSDGCCSSHILDSKIKTDHDAEQADTALQREEKAHAEGVPSSTSQNDNLSETATTKILSPTAENKSSPSDASQAVPTDGPPTPDKDTPVMGEPSELSSASSVPLSPPRQSASSASGMSSPEKSTSRTPPLATGTDPSSASPAIEPSINQSVQEPLEEQSAAKNEVPLSEALHAVRDALLNE